MLEGGHITHPQVADSEEVEAPKVAKAWGSDTCPACSAATLMWYGWHIDDMSIIRHLKLLQSAVKCGKMEETILFLRATAQTRLGKFHQNLSSPTQRSP